MVKALFRYRTPSYCFGEGPNQAGLHPHQGREDMAAHLIDSNMCQHDM